jgi:hypothetical protein
MAFVLLATSLDFLIVAAILFGIALWHLVPEGEPTRVGNEVRPTRAVGTRSR